MNAELPQQCADMMLGYALQYAAACPVFPCKPSGKRPLGALVPHGLKDASQEPGQIRAWWRQYPNANIGLVTGGACFVLDVDGPEGWTSLTSLTSRHGALPPTVVSCTGGGGWHYFFAAPSGRLIRNSAGELGHKLDVRGTGGYVVAPPSVHDSGRVYSFAAGLDPWSVLLAQTPGWLLDLIDPPAPPKAAPRPVSYPAPTTGEAYARAALEGELTRLASAAEGQRNETLNRAAFALGQLVEGGRLAGGAVVAALLSVALQIGLDRREAERTIESGFAGGMANPREACHA